MRPSKAEINRKPINIRGYRVLQSGKNKAVRPCRNDGYANMLNKYGTSQDNSEAYRFQREPMVPDTQLSDLYADNGLFAKIIDTPAEEALRHGFSLNLNNNDLDNFVQEALDDLEWEEKATTAIKWARLYGGAIIVMLINDGGGLEDPVIWDKIRSVDELRVYERAIVEPDLTSLYTQDYGIEFSKGRASRFCSPEYYYVNSIYGSFKVHESRCLIFRNGVLPERVSQSMYRLWGMPEYIRISRAMREAVTSHSNATKLLERSVQAIYSVKNLAAMLATDDGENQVLKRLEIIDMARNLLNSVAIDADGENYDFKTFQLTGVKDVIDATCNMLSALTNIPQTLLFGRSPAGMNSTGKADLENYYNFVERIQKLMLKRNLRYLLDVVFKAGIASGEIGNVPDYKLEFNPLWNLSDTERATVEQIKASTSLAKAQAAQIYVDIQAVDPSEIRSKLASDEEFDVEDIVEEDDNDLYNSLFGEELGEAGSDAEAVQKNLEQEKLEGGPEQTAPTAHNPPQEDGYEKVEVETVKPNAVGILVIKDGKVLTGVRKSDFCPFKICGAGGHIEEGETPEQAVIREAQEEFGITPRDPTPIGIRTGLPEEYGTPMYFVATGFDGEVKCDDHSEMVAPQMSDLGMILTAVENGQDNLFLPFADSFDMLNEVLSQKANISSNSDEFSETALPFSKKTAIIETSEVDDFNESDHPRDETGRFTEGGGGPSKTAPPSPSAEGENSPCTGFASKAKLKDHAKRHSKEVGASSEAEYQQKGIDFLSQPCGEDVLGYATLDGKVVRFNKKTCEYATGFPGGKMCTYMSPKADKKTGAVRPDKAMRYYESKKRYYESIKEGDLSEDS